MIEKCQCPKPEGADLHFRKATAYCRRCGAGICERCGVDKGTYTFVPLPNHVAVRAGLIDNYFELKKEYLCRTCAELEGR